MLTALNFIAQAIANSSVNMLHNKNKWNQNHFETGGVVQQHYDLQALLVG